MKSHVTITALALATLVAVGNASAQDISGGVKGGLNFATLSNGDKSFAPATGTPITDGSVETPRFIVGLFVMMQFNDTVTFQPEVLYSMQGIKGVKPNAVGGESKVRLDMIQVPLLLRLGHKRGAYGIVGPEFGFLSRATEQTSGSPDLDVKASFKDHDTSIVVGGGVVFSNLLVEARYAAGLSDINKTAGSVENKNQVFSVLLGVQF